MRNKFDIFRIVKKSNFEFLQEKLPELSALGAFAEQYVYADPSSAAVKLRSFAEKFVEYIYTILNIQFLEEERDLFHFLANPDFTKAVPKPIINLLHSLRSIGNKAAHGSEISSDDAISILMHGYDLSKWIYASYCKGNLTAVPDFVIPPKTNITDWDKERFEILKDLYEKEVQLQSTLKVLEEERIKTQKIVASKKELDEYIFKGEEVVNELKFSEEQTRKIFN